MKTRLLFLPLLFFIFLNASSQDGYTRKPDSLQSDILNQNRKLSIFLPEGYDSPNAKFPVVYVLDGDGRCQHIVPTARFLAVNGKMPKVIIVGVANIDRNHDFLPDSSKSAVTGGGADDFMRFFKEELFSYINKNYKTEPYKVLIGHSYGGVFAMYSLLTDPALFDSYISVDPSFWYKDLMLVKISQNEFAKDKNWDRPVYITGREDNDGMKSMGITPMKKQLESSAPKALAWKIVAYPAEDHGSVVFKSVYDGLRYIFDAGGNPNVYPNAGIIPKGASTYVLVDNNNPNFRYTTDGTEPASASPKCKKLIKISQPCTLKVKNVTNRYNKQTTVTRVFAQGDYLKGQKSIDGLKQGLKYTYYEGVWDSLPDFNKLTPVKKGVTDDINLNFIPEKDSFALQFEGYIYIDKKNLYDLWITSDDGSKVYINNQLILVNDGTHSADSPFVSLLPMEPGYYPVKIEYFQKTGGKSITFGALVMSIKAEADPFPKAKLFYKE